MVLLKHKEKEKNSMNQITLPIKQMVSLVHLSKNSLQFGDDMVIKPIPYGFKILDTFAGYETTVTAKEVGDDYTIEDNNGGAPYNWSSEGFINIYQEDEDEFYGFRFEV